MPKIESEMAKMLQLQKEKNRAARERLAGQNPTIATRVAAADGAPARARTHTHTQVCQAR